MENGRNPPILVSRSVDGHRQSFIDLFRKCLGHRADQPVYTHGWGLAFESAHLFYLMIEDQPFEYMAVSTIRAILGYRTSGLLFRGQQCMSGTSLRHKVKAHVFRFLRKLRHVKTISIVPFTTAPEINEICDDWIYDPQLWDLDGLTELPKTALSAAIRTRASGRKIVVTAGVQNADKGFNYLAEVLAAHPAISKECLFVAAGKLSGEVMDRSFKESGGHIEDRYLSDDELASLYGVADLVWCVYAPNYDQASGIFGRAVQFGVPSALREGSCMHKLSGQIEHPHFAVRWGEPRLAGDNLRAFLSNPHKIPQPSLGVSPVAMREQAMAVIGRLFANRSTSSPLLVTSAI